MTDVAREWVDKAEADLHSAGRELRARRSPNYDLACFCAQQAVEKYFKARLQAAGVRFPRTHDLSVLLNLLLSLEPDWELLREPAIRLTDFAIRFRYPGASASREQAREAVKIAQLLSERARLSLGLSPVRSDHQRSRRPSVPRSRATRPRTLPVGRPPRPARQSRPRPRAE